MASFGHLSPETAADWAELVKDLYSLPCHNEPTIVGFTDAGRDRVKEWINQNQVFINSEPDGNVRQVRSKLNGYLLKFALVIHLIERLDNDGTIGVAIDADTVNRAGVLCDWFAHEAARIYRCRSGIEADHYEAEERKTLATIRRKFPSGITARELMRATGRRFYKAEQAQDWLDDHATLDGLASDLLQLTRARAMLEALHQPASIPADDVKKFSQLREARRDLKAIRRLLARMDAGDQPDCKSSVYSTGLF